MSVEFGEGGYPIWRPGFSPEERRQYRRAKHRAHAARSRRLRGKEVPHRGKRGTRQDWDGTEAEGNQEQYWGKIFPVPGDFNGDGIPD